jgi:uncharacterized protein YndB with AHSA1/START domain
MTDIQPGAYAMARGRELARGPLVLSFATRLAVEPADLFRFISDFPRLPEWMPLINEVTVDNREAQAPGQVGAVRVIQATMGKPTHERVVAFEPGKLLAYSASDASLMGMYRDHVGVLSAEPHPGGGTLFTWLTYCNHGTAPMRWLGPAMFRYVIRTSIKNLERHFGKIDA